MTAALLAEVVRGSTVESLHYGTVLVLGPDGSRVFALGDPDAELLPRSAVKPLQAAGMLDAGLLLAADLLALAASSHSGEAAQLAGVEAILTGAGRTAADLANTPDLPLSAAARTAWLCAGGTPDALHQNCSGKHAAMLATCVANGWPTRGYLAIDHPLQAHLRTTIQASCGPITGVEIDGCGAPAFVLTAATLAVGFSALGAASAPSLAAVRSAMVSHPTLVGGTGRDVTALMTAVPGLVAKDGADGVYAAATADGGAVVVKIADGAERARLPVLAAGLARLGVTVPAAVAEVPVLGGGRVIGRVRPTF